jgi:hypothetical protein
MPAEPEGGSSLSPFQFATIALVCSRGYFSPTIILKLDELRNLAVICYASSAKTSASVKEDRVAARRQFKLMN